MPDLIEELSVFRKVLGYRLGGIRFEWPIFHEEKKKGLGGLLGKKETRIENKPMMIAPMLIRKEYVEKGEEIVNEVLVNTVKKAFKHKDVVNSFTKIFVFPGFKERFYSAISEMPLERKNIYFVYKSKVFRIPSSFL